ncbi:unannotated protein [freshwater metagenome]|uniref:Unannotated protein n=1 Tax=freshwater metagenome TaxID=449393 RepID=A0A6J6M6I7_9ZZZZ|nr:hypothetical protein [Actinomycetota bacterium]MSY51138.1 hypothetical protein [Actinomycetota bacterium]MSY87092.1 hypothetical protein [Actinomycetota bacterium]MTA49936.1 hypothetical protein [Actinomycetota bacterium]
MSAILERFTNELLPGNGHWPSASEIQVSSTMQKFAERDSQQQVMLAQLLDFLEMHNETAAVAAALEMKDPDLFSFAKVLAFEAYYTSPKVRDVIAQRSRYANRPPQPAGFQVVPHAVTPWNQDAILWRSDGTERSEIVLKMQQKDPNKTWTVEEIRQWQP